MSVEHEYLRGRIDRGLDINKPPHDSWFDAVDEVVSDKKYQEHQKDREAYNRGQRDAKR